MKRFIGEIKVEDPVLACDIIQALEKDPDSGRKYEIELFELNRHQTDRLCIDPGNGCDRSCTLKIFAVE